MELSKLGLEIVMIDWKIATLDAGHINTRDIKVNNDDRIFLIGANGSGKSSLLQSFFMQHGSNKVTNLTGHREIDIGDDRLSILPSQQNEIKRTITKMERNANARWVSLAYSGYRKNSLIISQLIEELHNRNLIIAGFVDNNNLKDAKKFAEDEIDILTKINNLLNVGSFAISIELTDGSILQAKKNGSDLFSISQLSDGERNAILVAMSVLLAYSGNVILIDEPERHLHRSIIRPFLSNLFKSRPDCPFLISTHDISLPISNSTSKIILVKSCNWKSNNNPNTWDVQIIEQKSNEEFNMIPDELKVAILGAREKILFVEGGPRSLDYELYSTLFPQIMVNPVGSCKDVINSVEILNNSQDHHHVQAFGLIDRDARTEDEVKKFQAKNIFAIEHYSIESLYFSEISIHAVAEAIADSRKVVDPSELTVQAINSALDSLKSDELAVKNLVYKKYVRKLRNKIISKIPSKSEIIGDVIDMIEIVENNEFKDELEKFNRLVEEKNWNELVGNYPLRESMAFGKIAKKLKCEDVADYEQVLCTQISKSDEMTKEFRQKLGGLSEKL